jgi:hypothetical protein
MNYRTKRKIDPETSEIYYIHENKRIHFDSIKLTNECRNNGTETLNESGLLKPSNNNNFKLFDMCLTFIATNLEHVDSLIGFPSQIGLLLFKECVKISKFNSPSCLIKFARAYPDLLIESLNLSSSINDNILQHMSPLITICCLKKLDLSSCNLNELNNFDLISNLKESSCSLEYLNLANNKLDENFIRKLTIPQRVNSLNFIKLTHLNLSHNYKLKSFQYLIEKYFTRFKSLNEIYFSCLKNEQQISIEKDYCSDFKLCKCLLNNNIIENNGWISYLTFKSLLSKIAQEKTRFEMNLFLLFFFVLN